MTPRPLHRRLLPLDDFKALALVPMIFGHAVVWWCFWDDKNAPTAVLGSGVFSSTSLFETFRGSLGLLGIFANMLPLSAGMSLALASICKKSWSQTLRRAGILYAVGMLIQGLAWGITEVFTWDVLAFMAVATVVTKFFCYFKVFPDKFIFNGAHLKTQPVRGARGESRRSGLLSVRRPSPKCNEEMAQFLNGLNEELIKKDTRSTNNKIFCYLKHSLTYTPLFLVTLFFLSSSLWATNMATEGLGADLALTPARVFSQRYFLQTARAALLGDPLGNHYFPFFPWYTAVILGYLFIISVFKNETTPSTSAIFCWCLAGSTLVVLSVANGAFGVIFDTSNIWGPKIFMPDFYRFLGYLGLTFLVLAALVFTRQHLLPHWGHTVTEWASRHITSIYGTHIIWGVKTLPYFLGHAEATHSAKGQTQWFVIFVVSLFASGAVGAWVTTVLKKQLTDLFFFGNKPPHLLK